MKNSSSNNHRVTIAVIILAIVFWFFVKMNKSYDYTLDIPLRVVINNPDYCLKYPSPSTVRVDFVGRGMELLQLPYYDPVYEVDLSDVTSNLTLNLAQHREYVRTADELAVAVKSVSTPHEIEFELDRRMTRKLPVQLKTTLKTDAGFTLVAMAASPDSVTISGPRSYVDSLSVIDVMVKDYDNVKLAFTDQLRISKTEYFYAEYFPEQLDVFFDVQRLAEKDVKQVPVKVINAPVQYEVVPLPSMVTIHATGGEKILAEAGADDFEIIIDYQKDWSPGATKVRATVTTGLNLVSTESRPRQFELIVQRKRNRSAGE